MLAAVFAFPLVGLVDPFSLLMRGLAFWGDPMLYRGADAGFAGIDGRWGADAVEPFVRKHLLPFGPTEFQWAGLSAAILAAIFALELVARRFWCRYLCPDRRDAGAGGPPAAVEARAGQGLQVLRQLRARCAAWTPIGRRLEGEAPASRMEGNHRLRSHWLARASPARHSRPKSATCAWTASTSARRASSSSAGGGRRAGRGRSISRGGAHLAGIVAGVAIPGVAAAARLVRPSSIDPRLLRPPGAADEKTFLSLCIRCGECMKVCPTNALQPAVLEAGVEGIFSPRLLPRFIFEQSAGEYKDCCEYACTLCGQVCPTGAIPRLSEAAKHARPTGKAYFDHSLCLPWAEKTPCIRCEEMCPAPEKAIKILNTFTIKGKDGEDVEIQQPYVDRDLCVGCGNCESKCTLDGPPAIRVLRVDAARSAHRVSPERQAGRPDRQGKRERAAMKAMLLGRVAPIESAPLELVDLPTPEPAPGEVRIRVRCCAVCRTDLHVIEGDLPQEKMPIVPGHQIVGTIDKLGPPLAVSQAEKRGESAGFQLGQRVRRGLAAAYLRPVRVLRQGARKPLRVGPLHRLSRRRRIRRVRRRPGRFRLPAAGEAIRRTPLSRPTFGRCPERGRG